MSRRPSRQVLSYDAYRQRVRRYRRIDVLLAVAGVNAHLERVKLGHEPPIAMPNVNAPFALAGVARTALITNNDNRDAGVTYFDLIRMCDAYVNVIESTNGHETGLDWVRQVLNQTMYEQSASQDSIAEHVGRTLVLLHDHAMSVPSAPTEDDWLGVLGVTLEQFIRLGFAMYSAAVHNRGCIDRATFESENVARIFAPLDATFALDALEKWFAATPAELKSDGAAREVVGAEKQSWNPLFAKPVVSLPNGLYVVPWPWLLLNRVTPTGLYYIGVDAFGERFPERLGKMFQNYIGTQLSLLGHATVIPEISYGMNGEQTVDFFIIAPEVVVLVEVKASRPVIATRAGQPGGDEDVANKVGYAMTQIERTRQLVADEHPALAAIPKDRPMRGLVVTLEPFHFVNTDLYERILSRPSIPTIVASSYELERLVAVLHDGQPDMTLLKALTPDPDKIVASLAQAIEEHPYLRNPLLHEAWKRFMAPWSASQQSPDSPSTEA